MPFISEAKCVFCRDKSDSSGGMMTKVSMLSNSNKLRILGMIQIRDMICYRNVIITMYGYESSNNVNMNLNFTIFS